MLKDLLFLVSFYSTDRDRLILKLYCQTIYFKFINDFKACCINYYIISIKILSLTNPRLDWDRGLKWACWGGACCAGGHCPHRDLVNLMISLGATNWNWGLECACLGGHRDLVNLMISLGANYWNRGLMFACLGGHRNLVNLMIEKGATYCKHCDRNADDHLI